MSDHLHTVRLEHQQQLVTRVVGTHPRADTEVVVSAHGYDEATVWAELLRQLPPESLAALLRAARAFMEAGR